MKGRLPKCKCPCVHSEVSCQYFHKGFCWKSRYDEIDNEFEKDWYESISKIFNR